MTLLTRKRYTIYLTFSIGLFIIFPFLVVALIDNQLSR